MSAQEKLGLFLAAYEAGSAFVHLDARREGVLVPASQRTSRQLVLQFGAGFPVPIRDLVADDRGIEATLSFGRRPFRVVVPWSAVYAIVDDAGRVAVWEADLPAELASRRASGARCDEQPAGRCGPKPADAPKPAPKPALRLLKN